MPKTRFLHLRSKQGQSLVVIKKAKTPRFSPWWGVSLFLLLSYRLPSLWNSNLYHVVGVMLTFLRFWIRTPVVMEAFKIIWIQNVLTSKSLFVVQVVTLWKHWHFVLIASSVGRIDWSFGWEVDVLNCVFEANWSLMFSRPADDFVSFIQWLSFYRHSKNRHLISQSFGC